MSGVLLHAGSHEEVLAWHWEPTVVAGLLVAAVAWLALAVPLLRQGRLALRTAAAWFGGLWVVLVALASPLDALGEEHLLVAHMLQHELLLSVAAPLLLLGLSPRLLAPVTRRVLGPVLRRPRGRRVLRVVAGPEAALAAFTAAVWVWHLPAAYAAALASPVLHVAEHVTFLTAGVLLWLPLLEPVPGVVHLGVRGKLAYLAVAQAVGGVVAAVLLWWPDLLYGWYAERPGLLGLSDLADQRLAGAAMLVVDMVLALAVGLWVLLAGLARDERRARRGGRVAEAVTWPST